MIKHMDIVMGFLLGFAIGALIFGLMAIIINY
jgi:hypothetical protein